MIKKEDAAVLSTFFECFRSFQDPSIVQPILQNDPKATVVITGVDGYFFNNVAIKNPQDNSGLIEELVALQADLKKPLTVWITAETQTPDFAEILKSRFNTPGAFYGMLLDVTQAQLTPAPPAVTVEQVSNDEDAKHFANIFSDIFHMPNTRGSIASWVEAQNQLEKPASMNYIAKVNGEIAGVSSLIIDRAFKDFKCGGFYNACVLPAFRKSGVATAMACHRINVAKELGLKYLSIILMSDAMARGYCAKLGFKNYSTLTPYLIG